MPSFGQRIKRERELRGVTLEDIAESTKIGKRNLQALEDEDFHKLPGGIFNKGFVRAYAKYLGIDEEQAVADYLEAEMAAATGKRPVYVAPVIEDFPEVAGAGGKTKGKDGGDGKGTKGAAEREGAKKEDESNPPLNPDPTANRLWVAGAILLLVLAFLAWRTLTKPSNPEAPKTTAPASGEAQPANRVAQPASATAGVDGNTASPVAASPDATTHPGGNPAAPDAGSNLRPADGATNPATSGGTDSAATHRDDGVVVLVKATEDSWVQVSADGNSVMDGVMLAKTEREFRANATLVLKSGNAGGLEVTQNGKALGVFGKEKQVKTATFTPQGMQP
jgi:cytoskeleton protein RodZ